MVCGKVAAVLLAAASLGRSADDVIMPFYAGLNLPPNQGSSGTGAFMPGVYQYTYTAQNVADIRWHGFTAVRLPVNVPTALDEASLATLRSYVDAVGGQAMLCMFGTSETDGHGTGRVDDLEATTKAWASMHEVFGDYPGVRYEILNEPFGYAVADEYYSDMMAIITGAGLPLDRCVLAGMSWENQLQPLVDLGWTGDIGYHVYPNWLADGERTQEGFSSKVQSDLAGLSSRVWITEFGGRLDLPNINYEEYEPSGNGGDVNCLRGVHDALLALRARGTPVKGVFHWHGWHNGDSYDLWDSGNVNGANKVKKIMADLTADIEPVEV